MDALELTFRCPLPNGLHARPACLLADAAAPFDSDITLVNDRSSASASLRSVLRLVALDVREGDQCRLRFEGADAGIARDALHDFITRSLPASDGPMPDESQRHDTVIPRSLRQATTKFLVGLGLSPGAAVGRVVHVRPAALEDSLDGISAGPLERERNLFHHAVEHVRRELDQLLAHTHDPAESGILRAHRAIAADTEFAALVESRLAAGIPAGRAILDVGRSFAAQFASSESTLIRERAADVEDLCARLLAAAYGEGLAPAPTLPDEPCIVVADRLTPRQLLSLDRARLAGLILGQAGATSHVVILARSFNVPLVAGIPDPRRALPEGGEVAIDASLGAVIPEISPPVRRFFNRHRAALRRRHERLVALTTSPARTHDGRGFLVAANVASAEECETAFDFGADAIGLFRTEMLYMHRPAAPSEEEQFAVFSRAARAARDRALIIRTFDIGADKPAPCLSNGTGSPGLERGIAVYRAHPALFRDHLRAILRASDAGPVWIMAPMISSLEDAQWFHAEVRAAQAGLQSEGIPFNPQMPIGAMIEVAGVVPALDQIARTMDFFSIGTNDLAQSHFGLDRATRQSAIDTTLDPRFLELLVDIAAAARRRGKWVGLCGEMAAHPECLPLLIGLGLDEISTAAPAIPALKAAAAQCDAAECRALLHDALRCPDAAAVRALLTAAPANSQHDDLLHPDLVLFDSDATTRAQAIRDIIDALHAAGRTDRPHDVENAVWIREDKYSTGLGHGIAIPHAKTDAMSANSIGIARLRTPVKWDALDGQPVHFVILIALRETGAADAHLRIISTLARSLVRDEFRQQLLAAPDSAAIIQFLADHLGAKRPEA